MNRPSVYEKLTKKKACEIQLFSLNLSYGASICLFRLRLGALFEMICAILWIRFSVKDLLTILS